MSARRLSDEQLGNIAHRFRDGAMPGAIARDLGLPSHLVVKSCRRISAALSIPTASERAAERKDAIYGEVERRLQSGESAAAIAAALGRSHSAIAHIRQRLGLGVRRQLHLSDAEKAEIDRRLIAGEKPREIAVAIGCSTKPVTDRRKIVRELIPSFPPCRCGRPHNHDGGCAMSPENLAIARAMFEQGAAISDVARAIGYTGQGVATATKAMIADLRDSGVTCRCGKSLAHGYACAGRHSNSALRQRNAEHLRRIEPLLKSGQSRRSIAIALGIESQTVYKLAAPLLAQWASEGMLCACGQPIDHKEVCTARFSPNRRKGGLRATRAAYSAASLQIPGADRNRIRRMAERGKSDAHIAGIVGVDAHLVRSVIRDMETAGAVFPDCKCGRERSHRGACFKPRRAPQKKRGPHPLEIVVDQKVWRLMYDQYKRGVSAATISRKTGVGIDVVSKYIRRWLKRRRKPLPPCACGRPAYHVGGCSKNSPWALGKRWLARIEAMISEGQSVSAIADHLGITFGPVAKHALEAMARLYESGVTCGCGRQVGHTGHCSANWDALGIPRGPKPLDTDVRARAEAALFTGVNLSELAASTAIPLKQLVRVRRELSPDDRARRARAIRQRATLQNDRHHATDVFAQVQGAIPRWIDPAVRSDVASEVYLAIMEGRLEIEQLGTAIRTFARRGLAAWSPQKGPRSMDEALGADDDRTLGEMIGDDTSEALLEDITIGNDHD